MKMIKKLFLKKDDNNDYLKASLLFTFLIIVFFWLFIGLFHFSIDEEFINNNFIYPKNYFYNNTGQMLQYFVSLVGFILFFPFIYHFIRKKNYEKIHIFGVIFDILLFLLIIFSIYALSQNVFVFLFLLILFVFLYCFLYKRYDFIDTIVVKHQDLKIFLLIIYTSILYIDSSFKQSLFLMHHVTAYYNPIHKILNGLTPFVDFKPFYGCYSYLYSGILYFFPQHLHLLVFSIITSLLVFVSLLLTYRFLKKFLKDKNIILFVFISFLLCNVYLTYGIDKSTYVQYMPHRYILIAIMLNYIFYYLKNPNFKRELLGFLLCAFMIFWNTDCGLIVAFSYTLFVIYNHIFNRKYNCVFFTILLFIASIVGTFILIELLTYIRIGSLIGVKDIFYSTLLFSNSGFLSLKLNFFSKPWVIIFIGYFIFLGISIVNLFNKKDKNKSIDFYLSILGLGIFIYFIQRPVLIKFMFIIVPLLFLMSNVNLKKFSVLNRICNICFTLICFIFIFASFYYKFLVKKETAQDKQYNQLLLFSKDVGSENFEMYINCDIIYYELLNKKDHKGITSFVDLVEKKDLNKLIKYIEDSDKNVVVSFEFVISHYNDFMTDKIKKKYYIYYNTNQEIIIDDDFYDKYVFFIKKSDLKKISNIDELHKFEELEVINE